MVRADPPPLLAIPEERKRLELRHAQEREEAENQSFRTLVLPLLVFALWQCIGALLMLASAHTQSTSNGQVLFAAAFAVGYGGAFFHLIVYYVQGRERGDW